MTRNIFIMFVASVAMAAGCARETSPPTASRTASTTDGSKYLLTAEPEGAEDVIAVRDSAGDEQEVVVVGRIGGGGHPWVDGLAAFSIVDSSLLACSDREGDMCPQPWDYCCETDRLSTSKALVKIVDENDALVEADARELLTVKELQTVVVRGKAKRDDAGNLTVLATGVYVREK